LILAPGLVLAVTALSPASGRIEAAPQGQPVRPPNIVLIFADDLGYGDLGVYGHPTIKTPRLDRLAAEGVKLTSFYAAAPACTPSRAALLTGRYPIRSGMSDVLMPESTQGLPQAEVTLPELLKSAGYRTAMVGKWHLGSMPAFMPTEHGFDSYFGLLYSNDMVRPWVQTDVPLRLHRQAEAVPGEVDVPILTEKYTEEAVRVIGAHRDRPFFLYLAHAMPHVPLGVPPRFAGRSAGGRYGDVIEMLDWSTGQVLDALREAGLESNTLVIFTSDNGPWQEMPPRMLVDPRVVQTDAGSAGPLRGSKATTWEGGMREPFIARWPGHIPQGIVSSELATTMDLLPTIARLVRVPPPVDRPIDGRDILPVLSGTGVSPHDVFFYVNVRQLEGVRDARWKLRLRKSPPGNRVIAELYDLSLDPSERYDVAAAHADTVERLYTRMRQFAKDTGAALEPLPDTR
jgi:arylsulfatase A-like enzyme